MAKIFEKNVADLATAEYRTLAQIFRECEQRAKDGVANIGLFAGEMNELIQSVKSPTGEAKRFVEVFSKNSAWEPQTRLIVKVADVLRLRPTEKRDRYVSSKSAEEALPPEIKPEPEGT